MTLDVWRGSEVRHSFSLEEAISFFASALKESEGDVDRASALFRSTMARLKRR